MSNQKPKTGSSNISKALSPRWKLLASSVHRGDYCAYDDNDEESFASDDYELNPHDVRLFNQVDCMNDVAALDPIDGHQFPHVHKDLNRRTVLTDVLLDCVEAFSNDKEIIQMIEQQHQTDIILQKTNRDLETFLQQSQGKLLKLKGLRDDHQELIGRIKNGITDINDRVKKLRIKIDASLNDTTIATNI